MNINTGSIGLRPALFLAEKSFKSDSFDYVGTIREEWMGVSLNGKENFINTHGLPLSKKVFDSVWDFVEGFAKVRVGNTYKCIDRNGRIYDTSPSNHAINKAIRRSIRRYLR